MKTSKGTKNPDPAFLGPIPVAESTERNTESAWGQFQDLAARQDARFAATVPATLVREPDAKVAQRAGRVSLDEAMLAARRNNRVCPKPMFWRRIHSLLPASNVEKPGAPVEGAAWSLTSALAKRLVFREHLEWADTHGGLNDVVEFMASLREEDWHHMGD